MYILDKVFNFISAERNLSLNYTNHFSHILILVWIAFTAMINYGTAEVFHKILKIKNKALEFIFDSIIVLLVISVNYVYYSTDYCTGITIFIYLLYGSSLLMYVNNLLNLFLKVRIILVYFNLKLD
jgi:hypothetical protein